MAPKEHIYSYPYSAGEEVKCIFQNLEEDDQGEVNDINFDQINFESEDEDQVNYEDHPNQESTMEQLEELSDGELDEEVMLIYQYLKQIENSSGENSSNVLFEGFFDIPNLVEWDSDESE
jgi:hypothetical protein